MCKKQGGKMRKKVLWLILSCLMVLSLVLASCGTKTTPTTTAITTETTKSTTAPSIAPITVPTITSTTKPTQAAEKPQYGGEFTYRITADPLGWDPYYTTTGATAVCKLFLETISMPNLTVDRKVWDFKYMYVPLQYTTGRLVESWETPGFQRVIYHVRKGLRWQDKVPMNGRELTAYDIEWSWQHLLGLGSGYTKGSPYVALSNYAQIKSVTATDKYTVTFEFTEPSLEQFRYLMNEVHYGSVAPKEAVEKYGVALNSDWRLAVGSGPFMITDYVSGSSVSAVRNPNYWGYDELYPQNQLPYLDIIKILIIPDNATAYAALRTGKVDIVEQVNWQQAASIQKTNPELLMTNRPEGGYGISYQLQQKPWSDIRVRKALQKAIDIKTIAETFYGGFADPKPYAMWAVPGQCVPYDQWPKEVQEGFTYDPAAAKKLLADAGYPSGFKFTLTVSTIHDQDLPQVVQSYFAAIGVTMEIQVMDNTAFNAYTTADKFQTLFGGSSNAGISLNPPQQNINQRYSTHYFYRTHVSDPIYDALYIKFMKCLTEEEQNKVLLEAHAYGTPMQWTLSLPVYTTTVIWQPWLKNFHGERPGADTILGALAARMWIDQKLK
jgi:peptide/nickel transport system substrate-binding protein